jgi:hypothetical protein
MLWGIRGNYYESQYYHVCVIYGCESKKKFESKKLNRQGAFFIFFQQQRGDLLCRRSEGQRCVSRQGLFIFLENCYLSGNNIKKQIFAD